MPEDKENGVLGNPELFGTKTQPIPVPEKNIGIDTDNTFYDNIIDAVKTSSLDISAIESFSQLSQNRNLVYNVLDIMSEDSTISSILEVYAEDSTETNESGHIVWAESNDVDVSKYVNFLLDELNIDKHIYKWVYSLCKYGDLYLRLFRNSEYNDFLFDHDKEDKNEREFLNEEVKSEEKEKLEEAIKLKVYSDMDKYAHYIEMVPNPADMFELLQYGKTYAYIQAPTGLTYSKNSDNPMYASSYKYSFKQKDINVFEATEFVHASLEDNTSRTPEQIQIFKGDDMEDDSASFTFNVKRGQSILYNSFKSWRNLTLLENSLMLNRLTKSSIVRVINVEVGDMPKEKVGPHLLGIKQLIEQKTAINEGNSIQEYTNPGPMENNIYVPTHNGIGTLSTQQIGGDVDVKGIVDIDYFKNRFYSALRIPKQFLGDTDDNTGFNGGTSLTIISSRYAKTIKRIQNTIIQMLNDCINLLLLDKGLDAYINRFELHMVTPTTSEEIDRRDNMDSKIGIINNIMSLLDGIEDASQKLKILKSLLSDVITDQEVLEVIQEEIDKFEEQEEVGADTTPEGNEFEPNDSNFHEPSGSRPDIDIDISGPSGSSNEGGEAPAEEIGELPSAADLGVDMTDMNMEV